MAGPPNSCLRTCVRKAVSPCFRIPQHTSIRYASTSARPPPAAPPRPAVTLPKALPYRATVAKPTFTSNPTAQPATTKPSRARQLAQALRPIRWRAVIKTAGIFALIAGCTLFGAGLTEWWDHWKARLEREAKAAVALAEEEKLARSAMGHDASVGVAAAAAAAEETSAEDEEAARQAKIKRRARILQLETAKGRAIYVRDEMQKKIDKVDAEIREKAERAAEKAAAKASERLKANT